MNDFTKEELEDLRNCVELYVDGENPYQSLLNKLQSMIENYDCDHFIVVSLDNYMPSGEIYCDKCGLKFL